MQNGIAAKDRKVDIPEKKAQRLKQFKKDDLLVMYCGNIGINHDLKNFVQSAALLKGKAKLVLVGNGGHKITLKRSAHQMELENVLFLDGVTPSQMYGILSLADILYFPLRDQVQNRYGVASAKLLTYMLSGKPIIFDGETAENPVTLADCGLVLGHHDPQEIAGAIGMMASMQQDHRSQMGQRGREYVLSHRDYGLLSEQYLNLLHKLTGKEPLKKS